MAEITEDPLRPPQDTRRYFILPQTPEDSGYYVYGRLNRKPSLGAWPSLRERRSITTTTSTSSCESDMRKVLGAFFGVTVLSLACAAELGGWQPLRAKYVIFSGPYLAEQEAPTAKDRKLAIALEGQPAREVFDSIGPDLRDSCSGEEGDRDRRKGGVQCTYRRKDGSYRCWVGVNLRTGGSYPAVSC